VALKSNGVHIYRLIAPVLVASVFLTVGVERFHNCVLPEFNHRYRLLFSDISKKRPALTLEPNVFFDEIPNYNLLVHEIEEKGDKNYLEDIIINDYSDPKSSKTIIAKSGELFFSEEREEYVFTLFDVEVHSIEHDNLENYRRIKSQRWILFVPVPNVVLKRSNSERRGDREKSARMMRTDIEKNLEVLHQRQDQIRRTVQLDLAEIFPKGVWGGQTTERGWQPGVLKKTYRGRGMLRVKNIYQQIKGDISIIEGYRRSIRSKRVEIHKKYSIPVACVVFVLIGAPLGIMARQGGMAVGGGLSLIFFLVYWAFLIAGEQLADRGIIRPFLAMWSANILVGLGGIYLVFRSVREATFIPWDRWTHWLQKIWKRDEV
jgi:lipopolysaccharide export system permease protein